MISILQLINDRIKGLNLDLLKTFLRHAPRAAFHGLCSRKTTGYGPTTVASVETKHANKISASRGESMEINKSEFHSVIS